MHSLRAPAQRFEKTFRTEEHRGHTVYLISCFHLIWPAHRHSHSRCLPFCSASHVFCLCCIFQCAVAASCLHLTTVTWIVTVMATTTEPRVVSNAPAATSCRAAPPECVSTGSPGPAQKQSVHVSLFFFSFSVLCVHRWQFYCTDFILRDVIKNKFRTTKWWKRYIKIILQF